MRFIGRPILSVLVLAAAATLVGCDKALPDNSNVITAKSPADADALQKDFAAQCGDAVNCNPSVALLISRISPSQIAVCTSFLVAPDIMMTNKHCLPSALQTAGANCSTLVGFKFPGSNQVSAAASKCATVLAVSPYPVSTDEGAAKVQTDYAILKLQQAPGRPALKFDASGLADNEPVIVTSMSPDSAKRIGVIANYDCRAVQNTASTDAYTSNFSPVVQFNNCPIVHGNSGSPAIGSSGGVKAIIMQGAVDLNAMKTAGVPNPQPFGRATNFACLNEPSVELLSNPSPDCRIDLSDAAAQQRSSDDITALMSSSTAQAELIAAIGRFEKDASKQFHWTPKKQALTDSDHQAQVYQKFLMEPLCLMPLSDWLPAFHTPGSRQYLDNASFDGSLLRIKLVVGYDSDYRGVAKFVTEPIPVSFGFSPKTVAAAGSDYFSVTGKRDQVLEGTPQLALCTPAQLKQ